MEWTDNKVQQSFEDIKSEVIAKKSRRVLHFRAKIEFWLDKDAESTTWFLNEIKAWGSLAAYIRQKLIYPHIEKVDDARHIMIKPELLAKIDRQAAARGVTRNQFINAVLGKVIDKIT